MSDTIKTRTGRTLVLPSPEEDVAIATGISADPDTAELTSAEFATLRPLRGRPPVAATKQAVKLRLDPDVLAALRASGRGWQTRVNEMLRRELLGGS